MKKETACVERKSPTSGLFNNGCRLARGSMSETEAVLCVRGRGMEAAKPTTQQLTVCPLRALSHHPRSMPNTERWVGAIVDSPSAASAHESSCARPTPLSHGSRHSASWAMSAYKHFFLGSCSSTVHCESQTTRGGANVCARLYFDIPTCACDLLP